MSLRMLPKEVQIIFLPDDFHLGGLPKPRHPALVDANGVILPAADYLAHIAVYRDRSSGTVEDCAFILRDWFEFLSINMISWDSVSNNILNQWVRKEEATTSRHRAHRKLDVVFNFYQTLQNKLGWIRDFVGENDHTTSYPLSFTLTTKTDSRGRTLKRDQPDVEVRHLEKKPPRDTPDVDQVEKITDMALDNPNIERATLWWLCINWMYRSGLRRSGVSSLTISKIAKAMHAEGIRTLDQKPWDLLSIQHCKQTQDRILHQISALRQRHRKSVFVLVTEKGKKTREVPLPLDMLEYNLLYIWSLRRQLVDNKLCRRPGYHPSDNIFLSLKTGSGLTAKAIGNAIKEIFSQLHIDGSAHRLRAAFAKEVVRAAYVRARSIHGRAWDRRSVLLEASEALGHSFVETTLDYYLNMVAQEDNALGGEPILVEDQTLAPLLRGLVMALQIQKSGTLRTDLFSFLKEHQVEPTEEMSDSRMVKLLRSNT